MKNPTLIIILTIALALVGVALRFHTSVGLDVVHMLHGAH